MSEIHYECQRCTNCCRWPGTVALAQGEADRIAAFLKLDIHEFVQQYTELMPNRRGLTLVSKPNHECIFLQGLDCIVQPVKPKQCAGFPNTWNFPGWRDVCKATPTERSPFPPHRPWEQS